MKAIGKISGAKGLDGELKLRLYYDVELADGDSLMLQNVKDSYLPYTIEYILDTTKDGMTKLLKLREINDRNEALQVSKREIWVEEEYFQKNLPTDSWYQLIDYTLYDEQRELGTITDIIEMAQIILVVGPQTEGVFIPYVEDWVVTRDDQNQKLVMQLPEGLIDINKNDTTETES